MDTENRYRPFTVLNCFRQNESLKTAMIDVRIDFERQDNSPLPTHSCLIVFYRIR
jgi:hypothetical protein